MGSEFRAEPLFYMQPSRTRHNDSGTLAAHAVRSVALQLSTHAPLTTRVPEACPKAAPAVIWLAAARPSCASRRSLISPPACAQQTKGSQDRTTCTTMFNVLTTPSHVHRKPAPAGLSWGDLQCLPSAAAVSSVCRGVTLFVKVMHMSCHGCAPPAIVRCAARAVSTRVLPLPGPATTLRRVKSTIFLSAISRSNQPAAQAEPKARAGHPGPLNASGAPRKES